MKFGHHVVMSMEREQAFWWPWVSLPHIAPPTTRMFKEALMAMVVALNFVRLGSKLSPFTQGCQVMDKEVVRQEIEVGKQEKGSELLGKVESVEGLQLSVRHESSEEEHPEGLIETLLVDLMELVVKE